MPKAQAKSYHHGGVKVALIQAAIEALKIESLEAISMRKLASSIGVSHNAPYMHFPDKEALWIAISDVGFEGLMKEIEDAVQAHSLWQDRLKAGCIAYVNFAENNREYLLVMFRVVTLDGKRALSPKGTEALGMLARELAAGASAGELESADPEKDAVLVWLMLHGLTMAELQIGGYRGPLSKVSREDIIDWTLDQLLASKL